MLTEDLKNKKMFLSQDPKFISKLLMQFTNATGFEKFIFSASEVCHKSRPQLSPCWGPYGIRKVGLTEQFSLGLLQRATIMIL